MKSKNRGFTIVELLIVIIVIAVLAGISIVAYNGVQKRTNDTERQTDMNSVGKKLAEFRILNGHYPRHDDMVNNNLIWIHSNLPGLSDDSLVAPGGVDANSFSGPTSPALNVYSYRAYFDDDGGIQRFCSQTNLNNTGYGNRTVNDCNRYELRWRSEVDDSIKIIKSRYGW